VIRLRLDAAVDEDASGVDAAPPRQRVEIILRLDHFVHLEEIAQPRHRLRRVADVFGGDDHFLARGHRRRAAREIGRHARNLQMPADPSQRAPVRIEEHERRRIEHDDLAPGQIERREIPRQLAQLAGRPRRPLEEDDVAAFPVAFHPPHGMSDTHAMISAQPPPVER